MTTTTRDNALEASIRDACKVLRLPTIEARTRDLGGTLNRQLVNAIAGGTFRPLS